MTQFLIAFSVCFFSYFYHTSTHYFEYKGKRFINLPHFIFEIIIFAGYFAFGLMIFFDPIKINLSSNIATPLGLLIGGLGFLIAFWAAKDKKGFQESENLITAGIYSKIRHPLYLGLILIHIGFPIAFLSLLSLISVVILIPQIFLWKYWEEKLLIKKFGDKYIEYKKKTLF